MERNYSKMQLEDKALKKATMYFGQELLPYLKVNKKIRRMLPTEQIRLEAVKAMEDILFEMEDGTLAHFEFESVEVTQDDLRRFRMYDAYTGQTHKKSVITYVICSGKAGKMLTKQDWAPLLLTPLMSGHSAIEDRLLEARQLLNMDNSRLNKAERQNMEGVLYAFACKFLNKEDLNEIKEVLSMTVLGEMIWNDGQEKGLEKGADIKLINQISRKLQKGKTPEQIAEDLDEELTLVRSICEAAAKSAPEYNSEEIYRILKAAKE